MKNFTTQLLTAEFCKNFVKYTQKSVKDNFKNVYVTHNLRDTMYSEEVLPLSYYTFELNDLTKGLEVAKVCIPAVRYDIKRWEEDMVIVHIPEKGSYANEVNVTGGWSPKKVHTGYVENAIAEAIVKSYTATKRWCGKGTKIELRSIIWK